MGERHLDAFAVEDSTRPGYFVAVRAYPGVQLLVVSAQSSAVDYMKYQLDRKDYGEGYSALNASAVPFMRPYRDFARAGQVRRTRRQSRDASVRR